MYLLSQESQNPRIKTWSSHFITYQTQPKADTTLQRQGYFAQDARHTCTAHAVQDSNSRVLVLNLFFFHLWGFLTWRLIRCPVDPLDLPSEAILNMHPYPYPYPYQYSILP